MRNEKEEVQYIWHDGATIKEDLLVTMAKRAGSMTIAEHNILSLYRHILIENGLGEYVKIENEVRCHYNAEAVPMPDDCVSTKSATRSNKEDYVRKLYMKMSVEERKQIVGRSLELLMDNHKDQFNSKNDWIGICLVIRDRVDGSLSMSGFYGKVYGLVKNWWPDNLMIGCHTMGNFSRCVDYEDRQEAYYDMKNNPWKELCDTYWPILKQQILTNK